MLVEGMQLGHYRIRRLIGTGDIGDVYLTEDRHSNNQQVVVKILRAELTPSSDPSVAKDEPRRRFLSEARIILMLDHPHILPLSDYGEASIDGNIHPYFVMPFYPEGSLDTWMKQHADSLTLQDAVNIVGQAAEALQYVHDRQIIHQDIKPSNFLVRKSTGSLNSPDLHLADFKLTTFMKATTDSIELVGDKQQSAYIAPEQRKGAPTYATDQYALAVIAYQLLTDHLSLQGDTEQMMPPSSINPHIPAQLDLVLMRALERKPEDRYPSISEFAHDFQKASKKAYTSTTLIEGSEEAHTDSTIAETSEEASTDSMLMQTALIDMPGDVRGNDIHVQVSISKYEAKNGTTRTLTLPGERSVSISIPAKTTNGQVVRLEGQGEPAPSNGLPGALIVTVITDNEPSSGSFLRVINSLPRTRTALLIGLALLVIANSLGLWYFNSANQANAVGQASANITATARTQSSIASSVGSTETAQVNVTATVVGSQYPFSSIVALDDPLSDNTRGYGWVENASCVFTGGTYHVTADSGYYSDCIAANKTFSNFTIQVQMAIIKGDCGGILFRGNDGSYRYYLLIICQDGSYRLSLHTGSEHHDLTKHSSPAINRGLNQSDIVAVVVRGDTITMYVNNQVLYVVKDDTYSQGQIGFLASSLQSHTEVIFSNAKVWML